tara:strand:+ start:1931 stop:2131 length:201 start_codon:yes stop_codon:yes gene_type:complete
MKVADVKIGQLISIKNLLGVREFYLITNKQDKNFKVRAYKALKGGIVYLNVNQKCKLISRDVVCKN